MARQFHIEGTNTFLWWSVGLLLLAIWSVKDGWFPSESMVKHQAFNQTLAVLSFVASAVCAYVHRMVK